MRYRAPFLGVWRPARGVAPVKSMFVPLLAAAVAAALASPVAAQPDLSVDADGNVIASSFTGDGSNLTGLHQLAPDAVGASEIATNAVNSSEIAANAVGSSELRESVTFGTTTSNGSVSLMSAISDRTVDTLATNIAGGGYLNLRSADGDSAIVLTTTGGGVAGYLTVHNSAGTAVAGINGSNGTVWGTTKSFIVPDPERADRLIRYTAIEGPEAAIYVRGTAELHWGQAVIELPEHFAALVDASSITVSLTPRSADSLGLAAVDVQAGRLTVRELHRGSGSYPFDYVAAGVRKGYEDYEVYHYLDRPSEMIGWLDAQAGN